MPENRMLAIKPTNNAYDETASIPYGALDRTKSAALQPTNYRIAVVTKVCSTQMLFLFKLLGADKVIDYNTKLFANNGETYDSIFDILGRSSLHQNGIYLLASLHGRKLLQMLATRKK